MPLPAWSAIPFVLVLLSVAVFPVAAPGWWHKNRHKALVVAALAVPAVAYILAHGPEARADLAHELANYVSFLTLTGSLYVITGGIAVVGSLPARPWANALVLAAGAVLANLIGTVGASMLLVRPLLQANAHRERRAHLPVFLIFVACNTGGLLTPLGNPPLFLGYLSGVPLAWPLRLWPQWLAVNGLLVAMFYAWDRRQFRREPAADPSWAPERIRLAVAGWRLNGALLVGVMAAVLAQKSLPWPAGELAMAALALASLRWTPRGVRHKNGFTWGPIVEVAVLFAGIFATLPPALNIVERVGPRLGLSEPWQFFWLTGALSATLDNAPTYLTFGTLAGGGHKLAWLAKERPDLLAAVTCGAVFMGANSYVGNGPNFLVKSIAEHAHYRMPSFFAFIGIAAAVLLPVYLAATLVFFV